MQVDMEDSRQTSVYVAVCPLYVLALGCGLAF